MTSTDKVTLPPISDEISDSDFDETQQDWNTLMSDSIEAGTKDDIDLALVNYSNFHENSTYKPRFKQYLDYLETCNGPPFQNFSNTSNLGW